MEAVNHFQANSLFSCFRFTFNSTCRLPQVAGWSIVSGIFAQLGADRFASIHIIWNIFACKCCYVQLYGLFQRENHTVNPVGSLHRIKAPWIYSFMTVQDRKAFLGSQFVESIISIQNMKVVDSVSDSSMSMNLYGYAMLWAGAVGNLSLLRCTHSYE